MIEFISLDGVVEAPGGEDFRYPGWSIEFDRGEDGDKFTDPEWDNTSVIAGDVVGELSRLKGARAGVAPGARQLAAGARGGTRSQDPRSASPRRATRWSGSPRGQRGR